MHRRLRSETDGSLGQQGWNYPDPDPTHILPAVPFQFAVCTLITLEMEELE